MDIKLLPVKLSAAMRRKMREFRGAESISATNKTNGKLNPTVEALALRGLVKVVLTNTGRPFRIAVLTDQGRAWMAATAPDK
jgi:hypothetical protein